MIQTRDSIKAEWLRKQGYTIACFSEELFEGAEFAYISSGEPWDETTGAPRNNKLEFSTFGKVLEIVETLRDGAWQGIRFVYITADGNQVPETYGLGLSLWIKDPEAA